MVRPGIITRVGNGFNRQWVYEHEPTRRPVVLDYIMDNLWTIVNFAFLALAVVFLVRWWFVAVDVRKIRKIMEHKHSPIKISSPSPNTMQTIKLPAPSFADGGMNVMQALKNRYTSRHFDDRPLSLDDLGALLWAMYGINRPNSGHRTAPSAMALYPLDLYVFTAQGVWLFDPVHAQLLAKATGDHRAAAGKQDYVATAPLSIVIFADYSRITNPDPQIEAALRAQEYAMCAIDAGSCLQNGAIYAASHGLNFVDRLMVDPQAVAAVLPETTRLHCIVGCTAGYIPATE